MIILNSQGCICNSHTRQVKTMHIFLTRKLIQTAFSLNRSDILIMKRNWVVHKGLYRLCSLYLSSQLYFYSFFFIRPHPSHSSISLSRKPISWYLNYARRRKSPAGNITSFYLESSAPMRECEREEERVRRSEVGAKTLI